MGRPGPRVASSEPGRIPPPHKIFDRVYEFGPGSTFLLLPAPQSHYERAAEGFFGRASRTGALSRRRRLSPRNKRMGAAMKIEDDVPTTIPNSMSHANPAI